MSVADPGFWRGGGAHLQLAEVFARVVGGGGGHVISDIRYLRKTQFFADEVRAYINFKHRALMVYTYLL